MKRQTIPSDAKRLQPENRQLKELLEPVRLVFSILEKNTAIEVLL